MDYPPAATWFGLGAFAAILGPSRSVLAWGDRMMGGECELQLTKVKAIQSTDSAFAAILDDGRVIPWGSSFGGGGISRSIQEQLQGVEQIQSTRQAFAAIRADGSIVTWGNEHYGASGEMAEQLAHEEIREIAASFRSFAAIRRDGSVVTWGPADCGGDCQAVQDQLRDVRKIQSTWQAFAAL